MGVNYTPSFINYTGQGAFKYWCQAVLPLVYDDSLSYYELLNKVVTYLNNVISDVSAVETNVDSLLSAYNQLQGYVNDYFDNLDVQEEINNKLDEMAADGTLDRIIRTYISGNLDMSLNISTTTGDNQAEIGGDLDNAVAYDVNNYYLKNARVIVRKSPHFESTAEQGAFGIKNANSDYLVPYGNGNQNGAIGNPLGGLLCAASFINNGITYGNTNSVFDTTGGTHNEMVCSDFVCAALLGISYKNSRANGCPKNFESVYRARFVPNNISQLSPNTKDCLITREMAYFFAGTDSLYELDYDNYSNVAVGDILFFSSTSPAAGVVSNFMNIHHCSLVLDIDRTNHFINVLESGNATSTIFNYSFTNHSSTPLSGPSYNALRITPATIIPARSIWVAKPAWPFFEPKHIGTYNNIVTTTSSSTYQSIGTFYTSTGLDIKKGDIVIGKLNSNMNILNPNDQQDVTVNLRADGRKGTSPDYTYPVIWRSYRYGTNASVPNDRQFAFVIDDEYNALRLLYSANVPDLEINTDLTFDVYRL